MGLWHLIYKIFVFPGTLTAVTILAAFVVWALYDRQRRDLRRDAAKIVLSEIERAEGLIADVKKALAVVEANNIPDSMRLLKVDNWDSAQYQLTGHLPEDVITKINNFYTYGRLIDEALAAIDGAFWKNESAVRENAFRVNADYAVKLLDAVEVNPNNLPEIAAKNNAITAQFKEKRDAFNKSFPTFYTYAPVKPTNDIKKYLDLLPMGLSQGRVGDELRLTKLGRMKRALAGQWVKP